MSKVYSFKRTQIVPTTLEEAWRFFSDPANLQVITPKALNFKIISQHHGKAMYPGQIIEYTVSPLLGIPLYWMTEITHVDPLKNFIDEQRFGPYSFWHHQHHFRETDNGVEMTDIVHYKIPFWIFGDLANSLFVKKQLNDIFDHRYHAVMQRFPALSSK